MPHFGSIHLRTSSQHGSTTAQEESKPLIWEDADPTVSLLSANNGPRFASLDHLGPWFPEADPAHPKSKTWRRSLSKRKIVPRCCALVAALVLLVNLAAIAYCRNQYKLVGGVGTIYRGNVQNRIG